MSSPIKLCQHLEAIEIKEPDKYFCEECVKTGDRWVHLRKCQECGVTLCCNSSPNRHAQVHYRQTGHPVMLSAEPGEYWTYCWPDDIFNTKAY